MTKQHEDIVALEVELPAELLSDIDEYAVRNGYENPGAVVRKAIQEKSESHESSGRSESKRGPDSRTD